MAPLQETSTHSGSQPSHSQRRTSERCKIGRVGHQQGTQLKGGHSMLMDLQQKTHL